MTRTRAIGPGPRTIALPSVGRRLLLGLVVAASFLGCGTSTPPSPSGLSSPASSPGAEPSGPSWPTTTILAVLALGSADGELEKAGADLQAAADKQDLAAMRGAADGMVTLIDTLTPEIERLEAFPLTQPAAALYRKAFPALAAGGRKLRDAITAGDSAGILAGSRQIASGLADYALARRAIGPLVDQALVQQRFLVK
jgi:hypothetical protein